MSPTPLRGVVVTAARICAIAAVGGSALLGMGCQPDLGEPDPSAAREVVFYFSPGDPRSGLPLFAGQAMTLQYCAGGECHDESANGSSRRLAPAGFDFSMDVACEEESPSDELCEESTAMLQRAQATMFEHARLSYGEVQAGTMPPEGERREEEAVYFREYSNTSGGSEPLPDLFTEEGEEIFRVWLASGAPVIQHAPFREGLAPGGDCEPALVGECRGRGEPPTPPEPNWDSIYEVFEGDTCVTGCHVEGSELFDDSFLDLSDIDNALDSMVNAEANGECAASEGLLIVPGDPDASVLIQKMENAEPSCGGESMPQGAPLFPEEFITPIRDWITAGALRGDEE